MVFARKSFGTYHDLELSSLELLAEGGSGAWSGFNFLAPLMKNFENEFQT